MSAVRTVVIALLCSLVVFMITRDSPVSPTATSDGMSDAVCVPASVPLLSRVSFPQYAMRLRQYLDKHLKSAEPHRPFRAVEIGSLYCANVFSFRSVLQLVAPKDMKIEFFAVDAWGFRGEEIGAPDHNDETMGLKHYSYCQALMNASFPDTVLVRRKSLDAAQQFDDDFFDFVYIDALHTYEAAIADMNAWWPKLRPGGLFSGDDFGDKEIVHLVPWESWGYTTFQWGVVRAVKEFALQHKLPFHLTSHEHKMHPRLLDYPDVPKPKGSIAAFWRPMRAAPNWYTVKPHSLFDARCTTLIQTESWIEALDVPRPEIASRRSMKKKK